MLRQWAQIKNGVFFIMSKRFAFWQLSLVRAETLSNVLYIVFGFRYQIGVNVPVSIYFDRALSQRVPFVTTYYSQSQQQQKQITFVQNYR